MRLFLKLQTGDRKGPCLPKPLSTWNAPFKVEQGFLSRSTKGFVPDCHPRGVWGALTVTSFAPFSAEFHWNHERPVHDIVLQKLGPRRPNPHLPVREVSFAHPSNPN